MRRACCPVDRIRARAKMNRGRWPRKYSVQFYTKDGNGTSPFYFFEGDPHESSATWQVLPGEFDQMLAENAAEKGADVRFGASVVDILFEGDRACGVQARLADGSVVEFRSHVVVDASGQNAMISRKLRMYRPEPKLKKASIYTHYEGALRDPGIDEG